MGRPVVMTCPKCKERSKAITASGRKHEYCSICAAAIAREWRKANPEKAKASKRASEAKNPEAKKRHDRKYFQKNLEKFAARNRLVRRLYPERAKLYCDRWRSKNADAVRSFTRNYRARKASAVGFHTDADIKRLLWFQDGYCQYCQDKLVPSFHVDHMQPLSLGGSNWPNNLCLACGSCNDRKWKHTYEEFMTRVDLERME